MTPKKDFQNESKLKNLICIKETNKLLNKVKDFNKNLMNYEDQTKKEKYTEIEKNLKKLYNFL